MFNKSVEELAKIGADVTAIEIKQQPELWQEAYDAYIEQQEDIEKFINAIDEKHDQVQVIFTGAGTSAYTGEGLVPYLNKQYAKANWNFVASATTDILASPEYFLRPDLPTILVSFARSGNSPESVATIELAKKLVKNLYQVTITCAPEGKLAQGAQGDSENLLLLQPERSNDQGFAMTGSYTCMTLTALLVFDTITDEEKANYVKEIIAMGEQTLSKADEIQTIVDKGFERAIYLGAGGFFALAREAQLKILELTAGEIATMYETPLGFRHGPKSFINDQTLVVLFASNDEYTRKYDDDLVNEVYHDKIAKQTVVVTAGNNDGNDATGFEFDERFKNLPDVYMTLPFVIFGQTLGLMAAIDLGNRPDTPSPTGTVNRVVQGVILHDYQ